MHVGHRIRAERERRGISQELLADRAGVARPYLSRVEAGKHHPTTGWLERVSAALGCDVDALFPPTQTAEPLGRSTTPNRLIGPELAFGGGFYAMLETTDLDPRVEVFDFDQHRPTPSSIATILGIAPGEASLYRARRQGTASAWYRAIASWMPIDLFGAIVDRRAQDRPLFDVLSEEMGTRVVRADERVSVRPATEEEARRLNIAENMCVYAIQRVCWTDTHRVAEVADIVSPADRWELWYRYPVGSGAYVSDWPWLRHASAPPRTPSRSRRGQHPL